MSDLDDLDDADAIDLIRAEVERLTKERDEAHAARLVEDRLKMEALAENDELHATATRLQETLEAYGDGGNEGPSMHAFLGDYQLVKEAIGGSYTAEAFQAITEKAKALDELEAWLRDPTAEVRLCAWPDGSVRACLWTGASSSHGESNGPDLAAAIRGAIQKARGA
ncbi:MAG: hypothetical protein ABL998_00835 [Planctomycetota bacterium]